MRRLRFTYSWIVLVGLLCLPGILEVSQPGDGELNRPIPGHGVGKGIALNLLARESVLSFLFTAGFEFPGTLEAAAPRQVRFAVVSAPAGAEVKINQKFVGITPVKNATAPLADALTVQVERKGFGTELRVLSRAEVQQLSKPGKFTLRFSLTPLPSPDVCSGAARAVWIRYLPHQTLGASELRSLLDCAVKTSDWELVVKVSDRLLDQGYNIRALQARGEAYYRLGKLREDRTEKEIDAFVYCARDLAGALRGPGWGLCERWVLETRRLECLFLFEETSDLSIEQLRETLDGVTLDAELLRLKEELSNAQGSLSEEQRRTCYEPTRQLVDGILKSRTR